MPLFSVRLHNAFFYTALLVVMCFFAWSRYDTSTRVYFYGDGNVAVEMVKLMLETKNWDGDWYRLIHENRFPAAERFIDKSTDTTGFYNMSGYFVTAAAFTKLAHLFSNAPIPVLLRCFNTAMQLAIIGLLFLTGRDIKNRWLGLLAAALFVSFPLALLEAHYERTEVMLCLLASIVLFACLRFWRAPLWHSAIIGAAIGLSIASKISQLYLCLLPAFILFIPVITEENESRIIWLKKLAPLLLIMAFAFLLAIYLTVPFILEHPFLYWQQVQELISIQKTPDAPYLIDNHTPLKQLGITGTYFFQTLGAPWLFFLALGFYAVNKKEYSGLIIKQRLCLLFLCLFLPLYFSQFHSFFERNFSALLGFYCLIAAAGILFFIKLIINKFSNRLFLCAVVIPITVLYVPVHLDIQLTKHFFHGHDYTDRKTFQTQLKKYFNGFWFYQLDSLLIKQREIPTKPPKAPRIYIVKNYGDANSFSYFSLLAQNGFVRIGEFRSPFYRMGPNNITVYHEAASYQYWLRADEWPTNIEQGFFKKNF